MDKRKNFTDLEVESLLVCVEQHKDIVENKVTNAVTNYEKKVVWNRIETTFNEMPGVNFRTASQLQNLYRNLKRRATREDKQNLLQTGSDPLSTSKVSDERVLHSPAQKRNTSTPSLWSALKKKRPGPNSSCAADALRDQLEEKKKNEAMEHQQNMEFRKEEHELRMEVLKAQLLLLKQLSKTVEEKPGSNRCTYDWLKVQQYKEFIEENHRQPQFWVLTVDSALIKSDVKTTLAGLLGGKKLNCGHSSFDENEI